MVVSFQIFFWNHSGIIESILVLKVLRSQCILVLIESILGMNGIILNLKFFGIIERRTESILIIESHFFIQLVGKTHTTESLFIMFEFMFTRFWNFLGHHFYGQCRSVSKIKMGYNSEPRLGFVRGRPYRASCRKTPKSKKDDQMISPSVQTTRICKTSGWLQKISLDSGARNLPIARAFRNSLMLQRTRTKKLQA